MTKEIKSKSISNGNISIDLLQVLDLNIKISVVLFQTKDNKDHGLDLEIVLLIDITIEKRYDGVYQIDIYCQEMELMKEEEMKYFDSLLIIVYVADRQAIRSTQ